MRVLALLVALFVGTTYYYAEVDKEKGVSPLEFSCTKLGIDCDGIEPPTIVYTSIMGAMGLNGAYYRGEHIVYIDPDAPASTVVHEVTHYMLYMAGFRLSSCTSEEAARLVQHAWEGTPYNDNWRVQYGCSVEEYSHV